MTNISNAEIRFQLTKWQQWLKSSSGVRIFPRLVIRTINNATGRLSSSVGIVTRLRDGRRRSRGQEPGIFWSPHHHTGSGAHPASHPMVPAVLSPWVKLSGREDDHSPPSSFEVQSAWSYAPTY
jgi:hypothetical protein